MLSLSGGLFLCDCTLMRLGVLPEALLCSVTARRTSTMPINVLASAGVGTD